MRRGLAVLVAALFVAGLALDASAGGGAASAHVTASAHAKVGPAGRIKHVVVIFQENHSFDETLGSFCKQHQRCDGYVGPVTQQDGTVINMRPSPDIVPEVDHGVPAQEAAVHGGKMDGWSHVWGCSVDFDYGCLTYYAASQIKNLAALATKFVVSDRTFSMYDSPSWGGHIYAAAATQDNFTGDTPYRATGVPVDKGGWGCDSHLVAPWVNPKTHKVSLQPSCIPAKHGTLDPKKYPHRGAFRATPVKYVPTIFDRLDAKHQPWKLYSTVVWWAICPNFAECVFTHQHKNHAVPGQIMRDAAHNKLPAYSVLLPDGPGGTSQHNSESMTNGDNWIGKVVKALEHSPEWSSTAVFITYDDCGCFYDHVPPGKNPDGTRQGIRVPMVIVSPYAKVAYTDSHPATFASILRFTEKALSLSPLGINDERAYDYAASFNFALPPTGPRVAMTQQPLSTATKHFLAEHPVSNNDPT